MVLSLSHFHHTHILAQFESCTLHTHLHGHPRERSLFTLILSTLYLFTFLLSVFLFPVFHLNHELQPELYQKDMENLRHSAANEGEDTYDVLIPSTPTKAWLSDCVTSRFMRSLCWALLDPNVHLIRQPARPRTMIFSAQQQACTTLFRLPFLELEPRLVKALRKSMWLVGTVALLFSLFLPSETKNFVPSMATSTADAFDIVCRLDRN